MWLGFFLFSIDLKEILIILNKHACFARPRASITVTVRHKTKIFTASGFIFIYLIWLICSNTSGEAYRSCICHELAIIWITYQWFAWKVKEKKIFVVHHEKINTKGQLKADLLDLLDLPDTFIGGLLLAAYSCIFSFPSVLKVP